MKIDNFHELIPNLKKIKFIKKNLSGDLFLSLHINVTNKQCIPEISTYSVRDKDQYVYSEYSNLIRPSSIAIFDLKINYSDLQKILLFANNQSVLKASLTTNKLIIENLNKDKLTINTINLQNDIINKNYNNVFLFYFGPNLDYFNKVEISNKEQLCLVKDKSIITYNNSGSEIIRYKNIINWPENTFFYIDDFYNILNIISELNQKNTYKLYYTDANTFLLSKNNTDYIIKLNMPVPSNNPFDQFKKAENLLDTINLDKTITFNSNQFLQTMNMVFSYSSIDDSIGFKFIEDNIISIFSRTFEFNINNFQKNFTFNTISNIIEFGISIRNLKNLIKIIKNDISSTFKISLGSVQLPVLFFSNNYVDLLIGLEKSPNLIRNINI